MVIRDELSKIVGILKGSENANPVFEANLILRHFLKMSPMDLVLNSNKEIDDEIIEAIETAVQKRAKNEPLQYILKSQEFMGLEFYVDENVLVPRADTETLVEYILKHFINTGFTALDIGTGSGCIATSLAHFNKNAYVRGIDISKKCVEIAKRNAKSNGVDNRVIIEQADIFKFDCFGKYDVIVSNPPYIESDVIDTLDDDVKNHEPHLALDGGADGLDYYRHIVKIAPKLLKENGLLAFEVGHNQAHQVAEMMGNNFCGIEIIKDLCGIERVVGGRKKLQ